MLIIPDANVLISALLKKGKTLELFEWNDFRKELEFVAPEHLSSEIERNLLEIKSKSKLSESEIKELLNKIESQIDFIPIKKFEKYIPKALEISPLNDFPYIALSLFLRSFGQNAVIVSNDKSLLESLEKNNIEGLFIHELLKKFKLV